MSTELKSVGILSILVVHLNSSHFVWIKNIILSGLLKKKISNYTKLTLGIRDSEAKKRKNRLA